jgi:hypothetical protein
MSARNLRARPLTWADLAVAVIAVASLSSISAWVLKDDPTLGAPRLGRDD